MYSYLLCILFFLFLLRIIAADRSLRREGQLFFLILGTIIFAVEVFFHGISWLSGKFTDILVIVPLIGIPYLVSVIIAIIWLLFSIYPSWKAKDFHKSDFFLVQFLNERFLVVLAVAFFVGLGLQSYKWHQTEVSKKVAAVEVKLSEEQISRAINQIREKVRAEEIENIKKILATAPTTQCRNTIKLKTTAPGQEVSIFKPGWKRQINTLRVYKGPGTVAYVSVPDTFYVQVRVNRVYSNLYRYSYPRQGNMPTFVAYWPAGETLPYPDMQFETR